MSNKSMILRMALISAMFFLTFGLLYGASYTAIGYGNTIDEAKNEALVTLASQLSSRVRSTQRVVIKEATAGARSEESQLFVHDAQVDTSLELLGVRLDAGRLGDDGRYQINAFLDEQALPLYLGALGEVKRYIDDIERREMARLSYGEQQMLLLQLLRRYEEFEAYATISRALDAQAVVPELERTKAGVELDYWNLLSREAEALQLERTRLQDALSNAQMRDAANLQLQTVMGEIGKNQAAQQVWQQEQVRLQQESLRRTGIQIQAVALEMQRRAEQAVRRAETEQQHQDPLEQISAIEQKKQAYKAIEGDVIEQIAQQRAQIDQRYAAQIEEERGRPYRAGEMLAGRPTEAAQRFRLQRLDDIRRMQDDEVTQMERQLWDSASPALQQLKKEIVDGYKRLEETTFALDSIQDSVMIKVGSYNGLRNSWPVAIRLSILNQSIPLDLYVPYEAMTGEKVPDLSAESVRRHEEYERYLDSVDLFEAYFSTADVALTGSITYRIYVGENPSEYGVGVESVTLRRTDTGETIYSHKDLEAMDRVMYYRHNPATPIEHWYTSRLTQYHRSAIRKAENALSKSQRRKALNAMMEKSTLNQSRMAMVTAGLTFARMEESSLPYPFTLGFEATYRMPFSNRLRLGFGMDVIQMAPEIGLTVYGTTELVFPLNDFPRAKPYGSAGLMGFVRGMFGMWYESTDEENMGAPNGFATLATGVRYVTSGMWLEQRVSVVLAGLHQGKFSALVGFGVRIP